MIFYLESSYKYRMKIAGISMTYNDEYKLKEWYEHYCEYKDDLDLFVIVDNGSDAKYLRKLHETFKNNVVIIEREANGGCTAAYNDGIRYVLENTDIEAIAIIANDMRLSYNCLQKMYQYLYGDEKLGIVSTAILYINSDIVDNFGHKVKNYNTICCNQGDKLCEIGNRHKYTDLVSGGFTMAKREFYIKAGLQDDALFMYGDELDTTYKAQKAGYQIGVISYAYAWHWHINKKGARRYPASAYLINRNKVYLALKYEGIAVGSYQFIKGTVLNIIRLFYYGINSEKRKYIKQPIYAIVGNIHGYIGKMYTNKYTKFE